MVAPTKYKSVFTGAEIDEAIATMRASLGGGIINDFTTGGTNNAASAEIVKTLKGIVDANNVPANIKSQLLTLINTHFLSDAEYTKLTNTFATTTSFRGGFANPTARDAALATEYSSYTGGELSFVADDGLGDGLSELDRWDVPTNSWKIVIFGQGGANPITVPTASSINMFTYKTANYSAMRAIIQAHSSDNTQRQVQEVMLTHVGADTYISVFGEVGNSTGLYNLTSSINTSTGIVTLIVTTLLPNVTVTGKVLTNL